MACVAHFGHMYCTTAEVPFGPQCADEGEAWHLIGHISRTRGKDPRELSREDQVATLEEIRSGRSDEIPTHPDRLCVCGSGQPFTLQKWWKGVHSTQCEGCG
jgi:hypothetical protein